MCKNDQKGQSEAKERGLDADRHDPAKGGGVERGAQKKKTNGGTGSTNKGRGDKKQHWGGTKIKGQKREGNKNGGGAK